MKILKTLKTFALAYALIVGISYANDGHQWEINCSDPADLNIIKLQEVECNILKDIWDNVNGPNWRDNTGWGQRVYAGEWYGIRMWDDNSSIEAFISGRLLDDGTRDNNLSGVFPESVGDFINLAYFSVVNQKHLASPIPEALVNLDTLYGIIFTDNPNTGGLPPRLPSGLKKLSIWNTATFTEWTIPASYANLTNIKSFVVQNCKHFHGQLPDMSGWTQLERFYVGNNAFTFADLEPQAEYFVNLEKVAYERQADINETGHTVYFDQVLRIEPRLAYNPSGHDRYTWKKTSLQGSTILTEDNATRIYTKEHATLEDEGFYCYEVKNTVLTHYYNSSLQYRNLILKSTCNNQGADTIHAIHDNKPTIANTTPPLTAIVGADYSYSSDINDTNNDTLTVTVGTLPEGLSFSSDQTSFTIDGTPTTAGTYDINITVTDGMIPVHINYTLQVNGGLPDGFSQDGDTYTHDNTGNAISGSDAYEVVDGGLLLQDTCTQTLGAYLQLESSGTLHTGYWQCSDHDSKNPTLRDSNYPTPANASLQDGRIMVELTLTETTPSITLGGN